LRAGILAALAVAFGLSLSACGRRGPLEQPPMALSDLPKDETGKPLTPVEARKRRIPLDALLD
jgi:predicted small lipoprotein YifL